VLFGYHATIALALFQTFQYPRNLEKEEGEGKSAESQFVEPSRYARAFDSANAETRDEMDVGKKKACLVWNEIWTLARTF